MPSLPSRSEREQRGETAGDRVSSQVHIHSVVVPVLDQAGQLLYRVTAAGHGPGGQRSPAVRRAGTVGEGRRTAPGAVTAVTRTDDTTTPTRVPSRRSGQQGICSPPTQRNTPTRFGFIGRTAPERAGSVGSTPRPGTDLRIGRRTGSRTAEQWHALEMAATC